MGILNTQMFGKRSNLGLISTNFHFSNGSIYTLYSLDYFLSICKKNSDRSIDKENTIFNIIENFVVYIHNLWWLYNHYNDTTGSRCQTISGHHNFMIINRQRCERWFNRCETIPRVKQQLIIVCDMTYWYTWKKIKRNEKSYI